MKALKQTHTHKHTDIAIIKKATLLNPHVFRIYSILF